MYKSWVCMIIIFINIMQFFLYIYSIIVLIQVFFDRDKICLEFLVVYFKMLYLELLECYEVFYFIQYVFFFILVWSYYFSFCLSFI